MVKAVSYTLEQLEKLVAVSARTIRYYTGIGLLPAPDERGRYAYYSEDHVQRLRLIKRLKESEVSLKAIKRYIENMTAEQMAAALAGAPEWEPAPESTAAPATAIAPAPAVPADTAVDYIARVLAAQRVAETKPGRLPPAAPAAQAAAKARQPAASPPQLAAAWDRHELAPGIELNVRRDAATAWSSELDQLLQNAQQLFRRRTP